MSLSPAGKFLKGSTANSTSYDATDNWLRTETDGYTVYVPAGKVKITIYFRINKQGAKRDVRDVVVWVHSTDNLNYEKKEFSKCLYVFNNL